MLKSRCAILAVCYFSLFFLPVAVKAERERVPVWTYYDSPPFVLNLSESKGLTFDLITLLNKRFASRYLFHVEYFPRQRIDKMLANKERGIVSGATHYSLVMGSASTSFGVQLC